MKKTKLRGILIGLALLLLTGNALADENSWSTGGPYGASVWSIAIYPTNNQEMCIGTLENFLFKTTNGGADWFSVLNGGTPDPDGRLEGKTVRVVKYHPFGPDTMFIATARGAYKSTDAGQTWMQIAPYPDNVWDALEINRENPPVLFLANLGGSAFRSTDGGQTWIQLGIHPVLFRADPVEPNIIYAASNSSLPGQKFYKSIDSGITWHSIDNDIQGVASAADILVDPTDHEIVYFSRKFWEIGEALVKSTDGGESWTDITPPSLISPYLDYTLYGIGISPFDHNTIFVGSDISGALRSTDSGQTWEETNQGIMGVDRRVQTFASDPTTNTIYVGRYAAGIYKSADNGINWESINHNIIAAQIYNMASNRRNPDTLFTTTHNGLYRSNDGAASWEYVDLDFPGFYNVVTGVEVDPYDPSYVYASYFGLVHDSLGNISWTGALYRSTDSGSTWQSFSQGLLEGISYYDVAVANYGNGVRRLYLGSEAGLFYSDNLGESWSPCAGAPSGIEIGYVTVSPVNPDLVIFSRAAYSGGVYLYKSTDGSQTWEEITNNLPQGSYTYADKIICDPINFRIIYVTIGITNNGAVYKSVDGGQIWTLISSDIPYQENNPHFSGLAINPFNPENLFVYSFNRGIFQSHDSGQTWENFNGNLAPSLIQATTLIDPLDTSRVFLGIWGNSVWEITRTTTGIDDKGDFLPHSFSGHSYPNPFNPAVTIEYGLPEATQVKLAIYDILGRQVETLINSHQNAGQYTITWDASSHASGLYFYRLDADGIGIRKEKMVLLK